MPQTERSKSELLIEALGQYLDGLDGKTRSARSSPAVDRRQPFIHLGQLPIEEMLLEKYVEPPQPRYVRQLRPVNSRTALPQHQ